MCGLHAKAWKLGLHVSHDMVHGGLVETGSQEAKRARYRANGRAAFATWRVLRNWRPERHYLIAMTCGLVFLRTASPPGIIDVCERVLLAAPLASSQGLIWLIAERFVVTIGHCCVDRTQEFRIAKIYVEADGRTARHVAGGNPSSPMHYFAGSFPANSSRETHSWQNRVRSIGTRYLTS